MNILSDITFNGTSVEFNNRFNIVISVSLGYHAIPLFKVYDGDQLLGEYTSFNNCFKHINSVLDEKHSA